MCFITFSEENLSGTKDFAFGQYFSLLCMSKILMKKAAPAGSVNDAAKIHKRQNLKKLQTSYIWTQHWVFGAVSAKTWAYWSAQ